MKFPGGQLESVIIELRFDHCYNLLCEAFNHQLGYIYQILKPASPEIRLSRAAK